jgi:hypothetical protein
MLLAHLRSLLRAIGRLWRTPRLVVLVPAILVIGSFVLLVWGYMHFAPQACAVPDPKPTGCANVSESPLVNGIFFAAQTVTTTGFGSEVVLQSTSLQLLASIGAIVGSIGWAVAAAAAYDVLKDR